MFVGRIVVEDDVDSLLHWNRFLDGVEEADELLMAMAAYTGRSPYLRARRGPQRAWWYRDACNHGSWFRRGPSLSAGLAGDGPAPGSGSSHRRTEPRHGPAGRHKGPPYRAPLPPTQCP